MTPWRSSSPKVERRREMMAEIGIELDYAPPAGVIRNARSGEAETLSGLALRSKAHWGYEAEFLEACRPELTLSAELIAAGDVFLLDDHGRALGFYTLARFKSDVELGHFFVEPSHIGRGVGRLLWEDAVQRAARRGYDRLLVQSDPNAEGFYLRMGAERIGQVPSGVIPGRSLPLMLFPLSGGEPLA